MVHMMQFEATCSILSANLGGLLILRPCGA